MAALRSVGVFGALALACTSVAMAEVKYTVTDLGTLGGSSSSARSINNKGQIVGSAATNSGESHAFLYSGGSMVDLGTLGGLRSEASGINDSGHIVGTSTIADNKSRAFLYQNGRMQDLGTLGGSESYGGSINNQGQIVGTLYYQSNPWSPIQHGFLYSNGVMNDLGAPAPYYTHSAAGRINNKGQIIGTVDIEIKDWVQPALYVGDTWSVLSVPQWGTGWAEDINDRGQVVVSERIASPFPARNAHVLLYQDGIPTDLGTIDEAYSSYPAAINNVGQVVGYAYTQGDSFTSMQAFLYGDGSMVNLNSLIDPQAGWILTDAADINDVGQIVGRGYVTVEQNGQTIRQSHAFLLTPVPEPMVTWIIPVVLASLRRRRNK